MSPPVIPAEEDPEADSYTLLVATVQEAVAQGLFKPEYQDPDLVAQLLWAAIHGVVYQHLTRSGEGYVPWRPIEERVAKMSQITPAGLLRTPTNAPISSPGKPGRQNKA